MKITHGRSRRHAKTRDTGLFVTRESLYFGVKRELTISLVKHDLPNSRKSSFSRTIITEWTWTEFFLVVYRAMMIHPSILYTYLYPNLDSLGTHKLPIPKTILISQNLCPISDLHVSHKSFNPYPKNILTAKFRHFQKKNWEQMTCILFRICCGFVNFFHCLFSRLLQLLSNCLFFNHH